MRILNQFSKVVALTAVLPLAIPSLPHSVNAFELPSQRRDAIAPKVARTDPRPTDVKLLPGKILAGTVLDENGKPLADTDVVVIFARQEVIRGCTNDAGEFSVELPHGGVYWLVAGPCVLVVRTWTAAVAPPGTDTRVTLTPQSLVIRGQGPVVPPIDPFLGLLLAGGVVAAIAVPIALNNQSDSNNNGSGNNAKIRATSP